MKDDGQYSQTRTATMLLEIHISTTGANRNQLLMHGSGDDQSSQMMLVQGDDGQKQLIDAAERQLK